MELANSGFTAAACSLGTTNVRQVSASFGIKGLHFIYPLLNRGVTAAVGGGGDNEWISWPKHPCRISSFSSIDIWLNSPSETCSSNRTKLRQRTKFGAHSR